MPNTFLEALDEDGCVFIHRRSVAELAGRVVAPAHCPAADQGKGTAVEATGRERRGGDCRHRRGDVPAAPFAIPFTAIGVNWFVVVPSPSWP